MSFYQTSELRGKGNEIVKAANDATDREIRDYKTSHTADGPHGSTYTPVRFTNPDTGATMSEDEFRSWLQGQFSQIPDIVVNHGNPDPKNFDGIIKDLEQVEGSFGGGKGATKNPDLDLADTAKGELGDNWQGVFAENLTDNMLSPFPVINENHGKVAHMLAESMRGTKNIYNGKRADLSGLIDNTIKALNDCGNKHGSHVPLALSVTAALTGVVAAVLAVPTAGGSLAVYGATVGLTVLGAGAVITNASLADAKTNVGGKTVNEVIDSFFQRLGDCSDAVSKEEQKMVSALNKNHTALVSMQQLAKDGRVASPLAPMRPKIDDAKNPTSGLEPKAD
ncbi:MAG TPA: hypothetical protein VE172_16645 [Stackebrandtia sp.]|jgi:hypothetical protein|uniref:hypothetical protein n=1 Tax=Stackebrandtia sp. TaxID=2023065 RepID=UPI002D67E7F1|nr:hypothetical protein [Stackebrandtia sp.]HZE40432.1 hypothetical protein [Stackebrandtia sp.]